MLNKYVKQCERQPMEHKKHILLLTTGGTIACQPGEDGLDPRRSDVMGQQIDQFRAYYDITVRDVMCLDSSNITPGEWQSIAQHIFTLRKDFDAIRKELEYKMSAPMLGGGTVFALDHRIPNGVPIENYRFYVNYGRELLGLGPIKEEGWARMAF